MTDENPKTFDLIAALAGRSYPKDDVIVFLDESLMYEYSKATLAADRDPASKDKEAAVEFLAKTFKEQAFTFHLQGVPRHEVDALQDSVDEEFPPQFTPFGQPRPNRAAAEKFMTGLWKLHVKGITNPDGTERAMSADEIIAFRRNAPDVSIAVVDTGIEKLRKGVVSGYEQAISGIDFLS